MSIEDATTFLSRLRVHHGATCKSAASPAAPLSSDRLAVDCTGDSMHGVRMRDIQSGPRTYPNFCTFLGQRIRVPIDSVHSQPGVRMPINYVVRFRTRDDKVVVADLLVAVGYAKEVKYAQQKLGQMKDMNDDKLVDITSLEFDCESVRLTWIF